MGLGKALLCIFLPPFAVLDKGCGTALIVGVLWLCGWLPGTIAAFIICLQKPPQPVIVQVAAPAPVEQPPKD